MGERKSFGKLKEVIQPPSLIQNQIDSFRDYLQLDVPGNQRDNKGIEAVFREIFPIDS
jgi:DNA-directed RNA polymerase subunit beta